MDQKVFVAGATGAIGTPLSALLLGAGFVVYGSTRRRDRAAALEAYGIVPVVVDVFDGSALAAAMEEIAPWAVIHQLTDLPRDLDPALMADASMRNARLREEGTRNLVAAAEAAGVERLIAQSIAWAYAPGPTPHFEDMPLDTAAEGTRRISVGGVVALERSVLGAKVSVASILRYGQLYGPGTSTPVPTGTSPVHVEAAASAAALALQHSKGGIFNITDDNSQVSNAKAKRELGWDPLSRLPD